MLDVFILIKTKYNFRVNLLFLCLISSQSEVLAQKKQPNTLVYAQIDSMAYYDQLYRKERLKFKSNTEYLSKTPASVQDSFWKETAYYDSLNFIKYVEILKIYGFIEKSKKYKSAFFELMLTHYISHREVAILEPLLLEELMANRMSAKLYAEWYDRYLLESCNKPQLYGEYLSIHPCVVDLTVSNEARKKIGLKPLKNNYCK